MNTIVKLHVNSHVVKVAHTAPGHSQSKEISPGSAACYFYKKEYTLKYVKGVSCVTQLSWVKPVTNVKKCYLKPACRGETSKVVQILWEGYTLPFRIRPNLTRSPTIISCYVNPHRNLNLLEGLHQLMQ